MKKISKKLIIILSVITVLVLLRWFYLYVKTAVYPKQIVIRSIETNYKDGKDKRWKNKSSSCWSGKIFKFKVSL